MKTDDLITMLATGASHEWTGDPWRRLMLAIGFGTLGSTILMVSAIAVNPEFASVLRLLQFWEKLGFAATIAAASFVIMMRLSQPGARLGMELHALLAPVAAMWILAGIVLVSADSSERASLFFGKTWKVCPILITMLATPVFAATLWAIRELAPTRLRLAGAAAGLFSGAVGAVVYCFHCPELDAPFIAFWYSLGIVIPAVAGALSGPRLLRW